MIDKIIKENIQDLTICSLNAHLNATKQAIATKQKEIAREQEFLKILHENQKIYEEVIAEKKSKISNIITICQYKDKHDGASTNITIIVNSVDETGKFFGEKARRRLKYEDGTSVMDIFNDLQNILNNLCDKYGVKKIIDKGNYTPNNRIIREYTVVPAKELK